MPKYRANGAVVGGMYIGDFEAPDEASALAMAEEHAHVSLCHQCSNQISDLEVENIQVALVEEE